MEGHTADRYGALKLGFISSTMVLMVDFSISAAASCFGVDILRPPSLCQISFNLGLLVREVSQLLSHFVLHYGSKPQV